MTTKRIIIIVGLVFAGAMLLITLFVGALAGVFFYSIAQSDAAGMAKKFLRENEKLTADIGEVQGFGSFITGRLDRSSAEGGASLHLKVIGAKRQVQASVNLIYGQNYGAWRVTGAAYRNEAGQLIELLDKYEPEKFEEKSLPEEPAAQTRQSNSD